MRFKIRSRDAGVKKSVLIRVQNAGQWKAYLLAGLGVIGDGQP